MISSNYIDVKNANEGNDLDQSSDQKAQYYFKNLRIFGFRNHRHIELELDQNSIVLYGRNGVGKTNILEAISMLNPGRGLRKAKREEIFSNVHGNSLKSDSSWGVNADVITPIGFTNIGSGSNKFKSSRSIKINSKVSQHSELSNVLKISWITPQMLLLFHSSMAEKRRFVDRLVNYIDSSHINYVYKYEKFCRERSKIINNFESENLWLETLEMNIVNLAYLIIKNRNLLISELNRIYEKETNLRFPRIELLISGEVEDYFCNNEESNCKNFLLNILKSCRSNRNSFFIGPHNSIISLINKNTKKEITSCSTGEQKLMLISFILNHSKILEKYYHSPPILLLDDITEHLDSFHIKLLFKEAAQHKSQCWFTSTNVKSFKYFPKLLNRINVEKLNQNLISNKELVYA